jgi:transposase
VIHPVQEDCTMPNALSADVRSRFRKLYDDGLTGREIGRRLMISAASASRFAQKIKRGVSLDPLPNRRKTGRGKLAPYSDFLIELVHQDPDITLSELQSALGHAHGVQSSVSGIEQARTPLGYTYKKRASLRTSASAPV